jgi:HD-GYP domain-containing protein (c-di-GMP phosphodiesterase class II)
LDDNEKVIMKTHARKGREMIDELLKNFGLENIDYMNMLRNIAEYHHESVNGGGYPSGLKGDDIPIEARIVAVADVFDALTSARPYKKAWDNERAIQSLRELAGEKLDQDCVNALIQNIDQIEIIQKQFLENPFG